ncbi:selenoprotein S [Phyllobates terribilis]|uniref:selenoprotein S n=1 Tax=Phyllobates terribilis TaxID=111132 RepID=UPI003CCAD6B4
MCPRIITYKCHPAASGRGHISATQERRVERSILPDVTSGRDTSSCKHRSRIREFGTVSMELGDQEVPAAKPDIEVEWSVFLQETVGTVLSSYGWFILLGCMLLFLLKQRFSEHIDSFLTSTPRSTEDPDDVVRRQEAVAAARLKMQEELNAQAEKFKEKQKQLEEEKRRQKIESWESMKEGKSYRVVAQPQEPSPSSSASSTTPKPKPDRKALRGGGYNPLTGDGGGTCAWRPGRRGPSAGG